MRADIPARAWIKTEYNFNLKWYYL